MNKFQSFKAKLGIKLNVFLENWYWAKRYRKELTNNDFSIICNTCIGGTIYHLLGMKFLSPTIDLYIEPSKFVKFCNDLDRYLSLDLLDISTPKFNYPVGCLGDVEIYFMHYKSFDAAKQKWYSRLKRINTNNLFVMMTDRITVISDNPKRCEDSIIYDFDRLAFKNKVCFTSKVFDEYKSAYYMAEYSENGVVGIITEYSGHIGKRSFSNSKFDFIKFINNGNYWNS
ncbi:MAG: DUF1919 domain-containing protein [Bacilli bacterium]|jgi:uncharacterized protein (DUF1919 family)